VSESEMKNGSYTNMHKMLRRLYGKYDIYSRRRTDCEQSQMTDFTKKYVKKYWTAFGWQVWWIGEQKHS